MTFGFRALKIKEREKHPTLRIIPHNKAFTDGQAYKGAPNAPLTHFLPVIARLPTSAIHQLSAVPDAQKNRDAFPSTDGKVLRGSVEIVSQFEGYCKQKFCAVKLPTSEL